MDFTNGRSLLALCHTEQIPISEAMLRREITLGETTKEDIFKKLNRSVEIMRTSTQNPLQHPVPSMGGLLNGESQAVWKHAFGSGQQPLCGTALSQAIAYAMAVLETNASMGLIVAAPTAGSAGVIPGTLLSICENYGLEEDAVCSGLLHAGAIGYLIMRNASVSGAEAGCQAEVGAASAMAASAAVELLGGSPQQSLTAASIALANLLGLRSDRRTRRISVPKPQRHRRFQRVQQRAVSPVRRWLSDPVR